MADWQQALSVTVEGDPLPALKVLTGRGFITGKSGSGKSNTASVVAEELLKRDLPFLIIDTDGEYYGLKEEYRVLHLGGDDRCDVEVAAQDAPTIVEIALVREHPVILDVSGFLDTDEAEDLMESVVTELLNQEQKRRKPFLLFVEEVHEYIPQSGGVGDLGERMLQIAKRGRKHGLGMVGMSQRPAAVDKNFITQCDWLVWHRLTWDNDTDVVARVLGDDVAAEVPELETGEAFVSTDWDERVRRVKFRKKRTFDAGRTPGLDDMETPEFVPVWKQDLADLDARIQEPSSSDEMAETDGDPEGMPTEDGLENPLVDAPDEEADADAASDDADTDDDAVESFMSSLGSDDGPSLGSDVGSSSGSDDPSTGDDSGASLDPSTGRSTGSDTTRPTSDETGASPSDESSTSVGTTSASDGEYAQPRPSRSSGGTTGRRARDRRPEASRPDRPTPPDPEEADNALVEASHMFVYLADLLAFRVRTVGWRLSTWYRQWQHDRGTDQRRDGLASQPAASTPEWRERLSDPTTVGALVAAVLLVLLVAGVFLV